MILGGEEMEVKRRMDLFDKKFVYMDWDDKLKDKKVFVCDSLQFMREQINLDAFIARHVENNGDCNSLCPFIDKDGTPWSLAYYDPNYECKVAYAEGKIIQVRNPTICAEWSDTDKPQWYSFCEYRVKPEDSKCNTCSYQCEPDMPCVTCRDGSNYKPRIVAKPIEDVTKKKRRMTNRELARWIAEGNGEWRGVDSPMVKSANYSYSHEDCPVVDGIVIRGWGETEWHEPEIEED